MQQLDTAVANDQIKDCIGSNIRHFVAQRRSTMAYGMEDIELSKRVKLCLK